MCSLPFSLLLDFGDTCSDCTIDQIFDSELMKFDHSQHVNPLSTLLGSKSYFLVIMFGIILIFFLKK